MRDHADYLAAVAELNVLITRAEVLLAALDAYDREHIEGMTAC